MKTLIVKNDKRIIKGLDDIKAFERAMDVQIPADLASFLLSYEGCYLDISQSYYKDGGPLYEVKFHFIPEGK